MRTGVGGSTILGDQWAASCRRLNRLLLGLTDAEFFWALDDTARGRPVPTHFGEPWPAAQVFEVPLVEQVHHGAEISLLRDVRRGTARMLPD